MGATTIRELVASFGMDFDDKGAKKLDGVIGGVVNKLGGLGAALAGVAGAAGIGAIVHGVVKLGSEINDMSLQLGVNAQELQRWQFAAGLAGVDAGTLSTSIRKLQQNASAAAGGSKEMAAGFAQVGVSVRDANGEVKSGDQLLNEASIGLAGMTNETERVALATKLFGRAGARLLPLFKEGAEGIAKFKAEADELGGVMSKELIEQSDAVGDNLDRMAYASRGLKLQVGSLLMPVLVRMTEALVRGAKWMIAFSKKTKVVQAALAAVGFVAARTAAALIAPFIPALLIAAAYVLVIDELWTTFDGGDTILRRTIDSLLYVGATKDGVDALKEASAGLFWVYENQLNPALQEFGAFVHESTSTWLSDLKEVSSFIGDSIGGAIDAASESFAGFVDDWVAGFDMLKQALPAKLAAFIGIDQTVRAPREGARDRLAKRQAEFAKRDAQDAGASADRRTLTRGTGAAFAANRAGADATMTAARAQERMDKAINRRGTGNVAAPGAARGAYQAVVQQANTMHVNVNVPPGTSVENATKMVQDAIDNSHKRQLRRAHHALKTEAP